MISITYKNNNLFNKTLYGVFKININLFKQKFVKT